MSELQEVIPDEDSNSSASTTSGAEQPLQGARAPIHARSPQAKQKPLDGFLVPLVLLAITVLLAVLLGLAGIFQGGRNGNTECRAIGNSVTCERIPQGIRGGQTEEEYQCKLKVQLVNSEEEPENQVSKTCTMKTARTESELVELAETEYPINSTRSCHTKRNEGVKLIICNDPWAGIATFAKVVGIFAAVTVFAFIIAYCRSKSRSKSRLHPLGTE